MLSIFLKIILFVLSAFNLSPTLSNATQSKKPCWSAARVLMSFTFLAAMSSSSSDYVTQCICACMHVSVMFFILSFFCNSLRRPCPKLYWPSKLYQPPKLFWSQKLYCESLSKFEAWNHTLTLKLKFEFVVQIWSSTWKF